MNERTVMPAALTGYGSPINTLKLGRNLAALRERDIFVLGSGNVVDNLRRIYWVGPAGAHDWAERLDAEVKRIVTSAMRELFEVGALQTSQSRCRRSRQTRENTVGACHE
jgi:aromatic ring-opening dioxygenase catalytic subunit (LigB family)